MIGHLEPPKAVIFDMDGLMLDTEPIYIMAWQISGAELGYNISRDLYIKVLGQNDADSEKMLIQTFGENFPVSEFRERWRENWHKYIIEKGIPKKPGLLELLNFLEDHKIPKGVATSSSKDEAELALKVSGIYERFKCLVTGDQVKQGKPDPEIYLTAAEKLGVLPNQCMVFEDSEAGIRAAYSAGMTPIMVPDLKQPSDQTKSIAYRVLNSLTEAKQLILNDTNIIGVAA